TDNRANFPAFGIQKNGEAVLCVIEEGAPSASIMADVSGRTSSYNTVSTRFVVIHGSKLNISSTNHVYAWERELPEGGRFLLRYRFCAEDGYVGMAKEYRALLLKKNPELAARPAPATIPLAAPATIPLAAPATIPLAAPATIPLAAPATIPLAVELIGAVDKKQHLLGAPVDLPLRLTGFREMETIVRDLQSRGWEHVRLKLTGWFNGGVEHTAPGSVQLVNELGSAADFQGLLAAAAEGGYKVYGEANFLAIRDSGPFDGFTAFLDAARYINREQVILYEYSPISFIRMVWRRKFYLASPEYMENTIRAFIAQTKKLGVENIAFRTIGSRLAGDYNENRLVRREEAVSRQRALLADLRQNGAGIMVERGYAYILDRTDFITGMDLDSQGFGIANRTIPFYQIALHGLVPYTGDPINQAEDYTGRLLRTVETGAGLFFRFMARESAALQETRFQQYYSNEYGEWADAASALYQQFVRDFGRLYGQTIENHWFLAPKVTVTEYADGTQVVVNAGSVPWEYRGRIVPARSYAVFNQGRDF
ncbi:MAG: DUF5696 domain-containing protein, partial [Treponema sp.]|nr:DUF5696 domain-containing protein [Treponema sp.]